MDTCDEKGEKVALNQITIFVQRMGGFGGPRTSSKARSPVKPPERAPDAVFEEKTNVDQVNLGHKDVHFWL